MPTSPLIQIQKTVSKFYPRHSEVIVKYSIDNPYFEQRVGQLFHTELHLNEANASDTEAPFLNLSITNGKVSSKINDKQDEFSFKIVNFSFLDGNLPRSPSYGVYIFSLFVLQ